MNLEYILSTSELKDFKQELDFQIRQSQGLSIKIEAIIALMEKRAKENDIETK